MKKEHNIRVVYARNRHEDHTLDSLSSTLPWAMQQQMRRFRRWQNRQQYLLGRMLLWHSLLKLGYERDCLGKISCNSYGRPYMDDTVDFNITHSGQYVVCAVTRGANVGIDIEEIKPADLSNYKTAMSEEEWEQIHRSPLPYHTFYRYWTIKESVVKAEGKGMSIPFDELTITNDVARYRLHAWHLFPVEIDDAYSCTLATLQPACAITTEELTLTNFQVLPHE